MFNSNDAEDDDDLARLARQGLRPLGQDDEDVDLYNVLNYYNAQRKLKKAMALGGGYNSAVPLQFDPNNAEDYYNRGNRYFALARYEEALDDYTCAIRLDPSLVLAYNNRGNTYDMLGRREDALADYTHALRLNPNLALAYLNIGTLYARAKQLKQALPYFDKAAALGHPQGAQAAARARRQLAGWKGCLSSLLNLFH